MRAISASKARATLESLLDAVARDDEPVLIKSKRANAVLLSENAWRGIEETLYLISVPGMRESILEGGESPIVECGDEPW